MNLGLNDQHILVAGGLGGIGTKTVELLLEEGATVTVLTQSSYKLRESKLSHEKLKLLSTSYKDRDRLYQDITIADEKKHLSGFISLIGSGRSEKNTFLSDEESKRVWDVNYFFPRLVAEIFVEVISKNNAEGKRMNQFIYQTKIII